MACNDKVFRKAMVNTILFAFYATIITVPPGMSKRSLTWFYDLLMDPCEKYNLWNDPLVRAEKERMLRRLLDRLIGLGGESGAALASDSTAHLSSDWDFQI